MTTLAQAPSATDAWSAHLAILRHIAHGRWDGVRAAASHLSQEDDAFCDFVIEQHLAYFVVGRLVADQQQSLLPPRWMQRLTDQTTRWQDARRLLKNKLTQVCHDLADAGVQHRVLKGIPFAQRYYGDINLRRWADIDLLVHEEDVDRAIRLLWDLGYRDNPPCLQMTAAGPVVKQSLLKKEHELTLEHERILVDLHWRFRTAPAYRWREEQIWAKTADVTVDGVSYPVLSDEYALVLLLISTAHDIARGGCRLKHLLDVHQLLRCEHVRIAWPAFLENRQAENTLRMSVNMLSIVLDLWEDQGGPAELVAALLRYSHLLTARAGKAGSIQLVRSPRGGVENKLWFARVYGVRPWRDTSWVLRRTLRDPSRWFSGFRSVLRFGGRWITRSAS